MWSWFQVSKNTNFRAEEHANNSVNATFSLIWWVGDFFIPRKINEYKYVVYSGISKLEKKIRYPEGSILQDVTKLVAHKATVRSIYKNQIKIKCV